MVHLSWGAHVSLSVYSMHLFWGVDNFNIYFILFQMYLLPHDNLWDVRAAKNTRIEDTKHFPWDDFLRKIELWTKPRNRRLVKKGKNRPVRCMGFSHLSNRNSLICLNTYSNKDFNEGLYHRDSTYATYIYIVTTTTYRISNHVQFFNCL